MVGLFFCYALISGGRKGATMSKLLSYEDRMMTAKLLQESASVGAIGKELGRDRMTIAKEVKKHFYDKKSGGRGSAAAPAASVPNAPCIVPTLRRKSVW
jgi:IS30 family transposase